MMGERNTTDFYVRLLSEVIDIHQYPFIKLIIDHRITEEEYNELFRLLDDLQKEYEIQKEEGLIDFSSLLVHFAGMLNEKLHPTEVIFALKKEGYYPSLMNEFIRIMNKEGI